MPIEPPGLDPTIAAPVAIREVTWVNLYEGLVRIDREGRVQPSSPRAGRSRRTAVLHVPPAAGGEVPRRDGLRPADVKFAFDRARAPNSTNAQKQIFAPIDSIDTPDPATVTIKLKEPSGNFSTISAGATR